MGVSHRLAAIGPLILPFAIVWRWCSDAGCQECRPGAKLMGGRAARRLWHPVRLGFPARQRL